MHAHSCGTPSAFAMQLCPLSAGQLLSGPGLLWHELMPCRAARSCGHALTRYRLSNSIPLGFGVEVSTGISSPFTHSGWSSITSRTILGYLHQTRVTQFKQAPSYSVHNLFLIEQSVIGRSAERAKLPTPCHAY